MSFINKSFSNPWVIQNLNIPPKYNVQTSFFFLCNITILVDATFKSYDVFRRWRHVRSGEMRVPLMAVTTNQ